MSTLRSKITIYFRQVNQPRIFEAPNSSYPVSVRYEGNFVIVRDHKGDDHAFPQDTVSEVISYR